MSDVTIREALPPDFEAIIAMWHSIDRHTELPDEPAYLQQFHDLSPDLFLVAEADERIVGSVIGGWDGWRGHIARLAADPALRRKGIARRLVEEIESLLRARGARRIYALVDRRSPPASPFWESAGYVANDEIIQFSRNLDE
ncbi:MAG: GNAT family N-acetyltransferase [Chloroflexi bacterium]|nr:MAG: GNAT family N-acetyltransferase [Chloroflexota bacterium]